jgi:hypothetical protein
LKNSGALIGDILSMCRSDASVFLANAHNGIPIPIPGINQFEGWLAEIFFDHPLGEQVHDGEKEERFVGGTLTGIGRPAVDAATGVEP